MINERALEAARLAVEDVLIEWRDSRRFTVAPNGFVIREVDGSDSHIIRLPTAVGLQIGIEAYLRALAEDAPCDVCGCATHSCAADCDCCPQHASRMAAEAWRLREGRA